MTEQQREIGAQTASCPNCGTQLKAVDQPDGSVAYETCPSCYGEQPTQTPQPARQEAAQAVPRETGTNVNTEE